ncbi:MAG: dTMP kinase [Alphaproteobacteria bacterium]
MDDRAAHRRGRFVTLEGGEGAGKSTHAALLAEWLRGRGLDVVLTREPGGSPQGEALRGLLVTGDPGRWDPLSETLLHYAARREHLRTLIRPALARGAWVVCDRFADSTMAYQHFGQGVPSAFVEALHATVVAGEGPDLTLLLDLDPRAGFARIAGRRTDGGRYEAMDRAFHERVHAGFRAIAAADAARCVTVAADADPQTVQADLRAVVEARLNPPDGPRRG